ncbi:hypothetical protein ACFSKU_14295 [Pontibacter silvestris]|uniref:Uncharacterized protein n=1 Tax=Pontibacter silvestris TaxID=2305183 RepID=A0ABW4X0Z8_9BACT|nr:hypothetical protein [Pontibacter silvestris]MCC9138227.1 hypothetical protein [Pontibacter silvestris]
MEDIKLILTILLGVAYFLFTTWRKAFKDDKQEVPSEAEQQRSQPVPQVKKPNAPKTSFEDIMRELQPKMDRAEEEKKTVTETIKEKVKPVIQPEKQPFSYEQLPVRKPVSLEKYNRVKEREKLEQSNVESYTKGSHTIRSLSYAEMLRNPKGLREAVVLSEIFNRKYH